MIIYQIRNIKNNKSYIGQTVHKKFNLRYSGGKWWDNTDNPLLINAFNKYKKENFEVIILESNVESLDELNKLEILHADRLNCYKPNGYNLRKCGDNRKLLPHQIELIRRTKAKTYKLRRIDTWKIIEITNLNEFCRQNNIDSAVMHNMIHKNPKLNTMVAHSLYCLPERTKEEIENRGIRNLKTYKLIDKNGNIHKFNNIRLFAEKHNFTKPCVYKLLRGKSLYCGEFRLPKNVNKNTKQTQDFHVISPQGKEYKGNNLTKFAKEHDLDGVYLSRIIRGDRKTYKGWKKHPSFQVKKNRNRYISCVLIDENNNELKLELIDFKEFCIKNQCSDNSFTNLLRGSQKTLKGYKMKSVIVEKY